MNEFRNRVLIYKMQAETSNFDQERQSYKLVDNGDIENTQFVYKLVEIISKTEIKEYATIKSPKLINFYANSDCTMIFKKGKN